MQLQVACGTYLRHVVFTGAGGGRVVNFAPVTSKPARQAHRSSRFSLEEEDFISWLLKRGGLDLRVYRPETLQRRLPACLRALRVSSPDQARDLLEKNPRSVPDAISALVIGVTSFFRDAAVFDQLTFSVLPMLLRAALPARIWSVGCSDGDELYSIAILLAEMNLLHHGYLLGTDVRGDAIAKARAGCFTSTALRAMPEAWLNKYFAREGAGFRIASKLRRAVQWRTADMTKMCEPGTWDLILCRNAAMYFCAEAAGKLWEQFEHALRPGGYLVLGKAERPAGATRLSCIAPCIYRRNRG